MSKTVKRVLSIVIFLGIGLFLIWWSIARISPDNKVQISDAIHRANYWLVLPALIIGVFSHLFRAARWKLLIKPLGYDPRLINAFFSVMIGYFVNQFVPRVGEISRCAVLARYEKIPAEKLIGTLLAERAVDVVCLLLLFFAAIVSQFSLLTNFLSGLFSAKVSSWKATIQNATLWQWAVLILGIVVGLLIIRWLWRKLMRSTFAQKIKVMLHGVTEGLLSIGKMENKWTFIAYTGLIWCAYFSMLYLGFLCLTETSTLGLKAATSVLAMGSVGMIVMPGGLGAYPILVQKTLLLYSISEPIGLASGWIIWLAQTVLVLGVGLISFVSLPLMNKTRKTE